MADIYSNLELVNNAVQEVGVGDKRNRNNAIRKGLENPGLYQSTFGTSTDTTSGTQPVDDWNAPKEWGEFQYKNTRPAVGIDISSDPLVPNAPNIPQGDTLDQVYNRINQEAKDYRSQGFIPDNPQAQDYLKSQGWNYIPGYNSVGSGHGKNDATPEEGAGVWTKAHPEDAYKGMGMDWVTYSPTRGYGGDQYLKKAPKPHGVAGFMGSPAGMFVSALAGLAAPGLGSLFNGAAGGAGTAGLSSLEGALGAAGGMSVAPGVASSGLLGSIGSLSPAMSLVPGGAAMAGVASGALGSGGLFGNGGVFGSGLDTGSGIANRGIENFGKSLLTSGGDVKKSGINALSGGLASGLGSLFDSDINRYVSSMSKPLLSSALSGGTLRSGIENSLFGGASTGLGSLLNSTDLMSGNTQEKNALANEAVGLAKTLSRKRKVA